MEIVTELEAKVCVTKVQGFNVYICIVVVSKYKLNMISLSIKLNSQGIEFI